MARKRKTTKKPTQKQRSTRTTVDPVIEATVNGAASEPAPEAELPTRVTFKAPAIEPEFDAAAVLEAMQPIAKARGTQAAKIASQVVRYLRIHTKRAFGRKGQRHILDRAQQAIATIEKELAAHAPQAQS